MTTKEVLGLLSGGVRKLSSRLLTVLGVVLVGGWVLLTTLNSCISVDASALPVSTSELATDANIRGLTQAVVKLHDRVVELEAQMKLQQMERLYPDATHTHRNDHYHTFSDRLTDPGYHSHSEYAERDHTHWGYADEFHTHEGR